MRHYFLLLPLLCLFPTHLQAQEPYKTKVVASFSILGDMVHQVGGDDIELTTLIGPDSDVHAFAPAPADVAKMAGADLVIINGMGLEGWLERLVSSSGYKGRVIHASNGIIPISPSATLHDHDHDAKYDFHAWQDAQNGIRYVNNIRDALSAADPAHTLAYQKRARDMVGKLEATDRWIKAQVATVPQAKRRIITTHDAFGYYARAYGISFVTPLGISTDSEPTAADIAKLEDMVRGHTVGPKLRCVFLENIANDRLMHQLEHDAGAYIGGTLYSDALSGSKGPAPDYVSLLRYNTTQLVEGMQHNN